MIDRVTFWAGLAATAPQGLYVRRTAPRFPSAEGATDGRVDGRGAELSLLGVGDSIVAGVGAGTYERTMVASAARTLAEQTGRPVRWAARGISGADSRRVREEVVERLDVGPVDAIVVSIGVNDVTELKRTAAWRRDLGELLASLRRHSVGSTIMVCTAAGPGESAADGASDGGAALRDGVPAAPDTPPATERPGADSVEVPVAPSDRGDRIAAVAETKPGAGTPTHPEPREGASDRTATASAKLGEQWPDLVSAGEFEAVVSEARTIGERRAVRRTGRAALVALSEAARFSGERAFAQDALEALRDRFPGTSDAAMAAFVLGRLAEGDGSLRVAADWYARYRDEAPLGALVDEALGREMATRAKLGQDQRAAGLAARYLEQHPNGAYARAASSILER